MSVVPFGVRQHASLPSATEKGGEHSNVGQRLLEEGEQGLRQGRFTESVEVLQRAVAGGSLTADLQWKGLDLLGSALAQGDAPQYQRALEAAQQALNVASSLENQKYKLQSLSTLGWISTRLPDPSTANTYLKQAIDLALKLGEKKMAGQLYANLGVSFSKDKIPEVAVKYFMESLHLAQQRRDLQDEMTATMLIAREYNKLDIDEANTYWTELNRLAQNVNDLQLQITALQALSQNYVKVAKYEDAIELLQRVQALVTRNKLWLHEMSNLDQLIRCYSQNEDEAAALKTCKTLLDLSRQFEHPMYEVHALNSLARIHLDLNNLDEAMTLLSEAFEKSQLVGDKKGEAVARNYLAAGYVKQGKHQEAIEQLEIGLALAKDLNSAELGRVMLADLGRAHLEAGNYESAKDFLHQGLQGHIQAADQKQELICLGYLAQVYHGLNRSQDASVYMAQCSALAKELFDKRIILRLPAEIAKLFG